MSAAGFPHNLSFDEFATKLFEELEMELPIVTPNTPLGQYGFDSILMYEVLLIVEDWGIDVDVMELEKWSTLGEMYTSVTQSIRSS